MHFLKKFFDAANQSAEAVNRQIIRITQRNLNAGLDLAKSLASARDPFEIVKLQASFWWKQFNEFSAQAEEVHKRLFGFGAVPEPTPEPDLRAPAQESLTSPQPEHRPAAQDPAIPRAKQKPAKQKVETPTLAAQTRKTAESEVGRPKSGLRRSTAEKRSANLHPHPDILPGNRGSESLKQRGHLHARSFAQMLLGHMKDNPGLQKRVPLTSLPPKSFPWASNSECSMGTLFASPTLKLGGWLMALGGRFLQARFSPMPP